MGVEPGIGAEGSRRSRAMEVVVGLGLASYSRNGGLWLGESSRSNHRRGSRLLVFQILVPRYCHLIVLRFASINRPGCLCPGARSRGLCRCLYSVEDHMVVCY